MFISLQKTRFRTAITIAVVFVAATSANITSAATNPTSPWIWTDISNQMTIRANRPVWAMAYVKPYWYFTDGQDLTKTGHVWRTDGWTSKELTADVKKSGLTRVDEIVSNNTTVFFVGPNGTRAYDGATFSVPAAFLFLNSYSDGSQLFLADGGRLRTVAVPAEFKQLNWKQAHIVWTGGSWMILVGKTLMRYDGVNFQNLGKTRDYFVTLASDGNGTTFLGGAQSTDISDNPTSPLTAKLVKVMEEKAPSYWSWIDAAVPNTLRSDQTAFYNVGAWHAKGIKRIELRVNDVAQKTCEFTELGNQTCALALSGSSYAKDAILDLTARVTSASGKLIATDSRLLGVIPAPVVTLAIAKTQTVATTKTPDAIPNTSISSWTWLEPNLSGIDYRNSVIFKAQANTTEGVSRIDILVNGTTRRICNFARAYGVQTCDVTLFGIEFPVESTLTLAARTTSASSEVAWSQPRSLEIRDNLKDAGRAPTTLKTWMSPAIDIVKDNDHVNFYAQAQDTDGIERIEILADGVSIHECLFTNAYDPKECGTGISPSRFPDRTSVHVLTRVTDAKRNVTLSDTRYFALWR